MRRYPILIGTAFLIIALTGPALTQSPYERSLSKDGWIAGGSAAAGIAALVSRTPQPLTAQEVGRLSRESVNRFDRSATYNWSTNIGSASDVVVGAIVAAPLLLLIDERTRGDWQTCTLMYAETMALAVILPACGKGTVDRIRPFVYDPSAPMDRKTTSDARKSFFSRHTSAAFASAVFLSTVYGDYHPRSAAGPYVWAGSLLAAAAVGIMRYEAGEHFPSDCIAGAVAGCAAGYLIPRLHRLGGRSMSLVPFYGGSPASVALLLRI
jgi:hypothetical protein